MDKFLPFFAVVPNRKFLEIFKRAGVKNILISYHYIQKNIPLAKEFIQLSKDNGGHFMTDSGAFSMINNEDFDLANFKWETYLENYVAFLKDNSEDIYSACNLDMERYVGVDRVMGWNNDYFRELEELMHLIYVPHKIYVNNKVHEGKSLAHLTDYFKRYNYLGINMDWVKDAQKVYNLSRKYKKATHGLAWTKPTILNSYPMFSVDSTTWVAYQKYGVTFHFDGTNFYQHSPTFKDRRRGLRKKCKQYGVKFHEFVNEKTKEGERNDTEGLVYSIKAWQEVFNYLKKFANQKLNINMEEYITTAEETIETLPEKSEKGGLATLLETETTEITLREQVSLVDAYKNETNLMLCSGCMIADTCRFFKDGSICKLKFKPEKPDLSPLALIDNMIKLQMERVNKAMYFEQLEGGVPNSTYTKEVAFLKELTSFKTSMLQKASGGFKYTEKTIESSGGFLNTLKKALT